MDGRPLWRTVLTPRWSGLLLLALAIAAVMSVLGVWQLDVYQSKTDAATAKRAEGEPVALQSLFSIDEGLPSKAVGRRVTVSGTWAPGADQVFIADRRQGDRDGFWVATPLMVDGSGAVMVVRGWVASVNDPAATAPTGPVKLTGTVTASEAEDSSADAAKGRVLSSLRIPTIVHLVDYRLYDAFVIQSSVESGAVPSPAPAVVPPPPPPTDHAGLRNVAYAFQWWIFAAFTLWMWWRMVTDAHRTEAEPNDSADGTDGGSDGEPAGDGAGGGGADRSDDASDDATADGSDRQPGEGARATAAHRSD
ncbi:SURF1 family protein [Kribbella pittospori]|uniref:SURF1-like protein n=1 Tax=Kribbella pittospori TaxID=722689 RepID=A0A4R0KAV6_9ACTN|nr:SURF1 family protein [Kribbella pittospori]TCC56124.1 SURF1 family protein [Kribbella pittospori]